MSKGGVDFESCSARGRGGDDLTRGGLASWELEGRGKLWFTEVPTG